MTEPNAPGGDVMGTASLPRIFASLVLATGVGLFLVGGAFGQPAPAKPVADHIVEQYKIYLTDLGSVGGQFAIAQTFFLTMITTLVALFAFKEKRPAGPESIFVFFLIASVCVTWWFTAQEYLILIGAKFKVLKEIEAAFPALHPMFTNQSTYYLGDEGWMRGVIRKQSLLVIFIGAAAFVMAIIGIDRRGKLKRKAKRPRVRPRPRSA